MRAVTGRGLTMNGIISGSRQYAVTPKVCLVASRRRYKFLFKEEGCQMLQPAYKSDRMCHPVTINIRPHSFSDLRHSENAPQGAYSVHDVKKCDGCQPAYVCA